MLPWGTCDFKVPKEPFKDQLQLKASVYVMSNAAALARVHFDLRQPCLLMIEVGRRVITSPTTETGEQPSLSSGWSDAPSV